MIRVLVKWDEYSSFKKAINGSSMDIELLDLDEFLSKNIEWNDVDIFIIEDHNVPTIHDFQIECKSRILVSTQSKFTEINSNPTFSSLFNAVMFKEVPQTHLSIVEKEVELIQLKLKIAEDERVEHLLYAITDITTSLLDENELGEISRLVISKVIKHFHFEDCVIYELNEDGETLTQVAASGPKEEEDHFVKDPLTLKVGEGIVGTVASTGETIRIDDVSIDSRYLVDDSERLSELSVPILFDGKVIGVIDSEHHQKGFYSKTDQNNLEAVANILSIKFHAAQIYREKEKAKEELQESYDEKVVLLSEVHHRVKNNLAIISGLLHLQSRDSDSEVIKDAFLEMSNRIQSIASVHELLYNSESFADITITKYIDNLLVMISSTFDNSSKVQIDSKISPELRININQAVPLGLILNELVTNSFKYAFQDIHSPRIELELSEKDGSLYGVYSDNGPGFSPEVFQGAKTLGFSLIQALFYQLEADVEFEPTRVQPIRFSFKSS